MWAHDISFKFELYEIVSLIYMLKLWYFRLEIVSLIYMLKLWYLLLDKI